MHSYVSIKDGWSLLLSHTHSNPTCRSFYSTFTVTGRLQSLTRFTSIRHNQYLPITCPSIVEQRSSATTTPKESLVNTQSPTRRHSMLCKVRDQMHVRGRSSTPREDRLDAKPPSRVNTGVSEASSTSSTSSTSPQRSPSLGKPKAKRTSTGTFSECGRHSNDWLFNGFSVTGALKNLLDRRDT